MGDVHNLSKMLTLLPVAVRVTCSSHALIILFQSLLNTGRTGFLNKNAESTNKVSDQLLLTITRFLPYVIRFSIHFFIFLSKQERSKLCLI